MNKDQIIEAILAFAESTDKEAGKLELNKIDVLQLRKRLDMLERMAHRSDELGFGRQNFAENSTEELKLQTSRREILSRMRQSMTAFSASRKVAAQVAQSSVAAPSIADKWVEVQIERIERAVSKNVDRDVAKLYQISHLRMVPLRQGGEFVIKIVDLKFRTSHLVEIVVVDRHGRFIESLGKKNVEHSFPRSQATLIARKFRTWIDEGAEPTDEAAKLFAEAVKRMKRYSFRTRSMHKAVNDHSSYHSKVSKKISA